MLDLDLLHDKARVRLEREPPPPEAPSAPPSPSPSDIEQASTSVVPDVELESLDDLWGFMEYGDGRSPDF